MTNNEAETIADTMKTTDEALALAIDMLKTIAHGQSFDRFTFWAAIHQMEALAAIEKLAHVRDYIVDQTEKWDRHYEACVGIIQDLQARIQREHGL